MHCGSPVPGMGKFNFPARRELTWNGGIARRSGLGPSMSCSMRTWSCAIDIQYHRTMQRGRLSLPSTAVAGQRPTSFSPRGQRQFASVSPIPASTSVQPRAPAQRPPRTKPGDANSVRRAVAKQAAVKDGTGYQRQEEGDDEAGDLWPWHRPRPPHARCPPPVAGRSRRLVATRTRQRHALLQALDRRCAPVEQATLLSTRR